MLTKLQLIALLQMQDELNSKINPHWLMAGYDFRLAAEVELSEALDWCGWEWWKKVVPSVQDIKMEYIDALHFLLSSMLVTHVGKIDNVAASVNCNIMPSKEQVNNEVRVWRIKNVKRYLLTDMRSEEVLENLLQLCYSEGMSNTDIVNMYVAKNILNQFRKKNGYKEGTYIKMWFGEEDNITVLKLLSGLTKEETALFETNRNAFIALVCTSISNKYEEVKNAQVK